MKVEIDRERCVGSGMCISNAPEIFGEDDNRQVMLLIEEPSEELRDIVGMAANMCPMEAISVRP